MFVAFCNVEILIKLDKKIHSPSYKHLFVLRSVLGVQLRSLSCISASSTCNMCLYMSTCAYAFLFETIMIHENEVVPGRTRSSHPYVFTHGLESIDDNTSNIYRCNLTVFGKAVSYLPYIYAALVRAGRAGIFKERIQFSIVDLQVKGMSILKSENELNMNIKPDVWSSSESNNLHKKEILVELMSPLRFKVNGKYTSDFSAEDFFACLYRRMRTICLLYGEFPLEYNYNAYDVKNRFYITERRLRWVDEVHYSARQKNAMKLGGIMGSFKLQGSFTDFELSLLEFGKIANAGKNVSFGLGMMDYWVR